MKKTNRDRATGEWLENLRAEFVRIASRRVDTSDVEDVVQEAMRVIAEKGLDGEADSVDGLAPLAWCYQVLRNTIGNHYQRRRTRAQWTVADTTAADKAAVLESLDGRAALEAIEGALAEMARTDPQCARYLSRLADGERPGEVARDEKVDVPVFSRRLYRCRGKLRRLLAAKGVEA